jgi:hypothetical protein
MRHIQRRSQLLLAPSKEGFMPRGGSPQTGEEKDNAV